MVLVYGLMCWHCDSLHDPKCMDPFDNQSMPMKDCKLEKLQTYPNVRGTMCRKIRQKGTNNNCLVTFDLCLDLDFFLFDSVR